MSNRNNWDACPPGVIGRMVQQQRARRRRQTAERLAGTTLLLAAVGLGLFFAARGTPAGIQNITCQQAVARFAAYHGGTLASPAKRELENHFQSCPQCQHAYQQHFPRETHGLSSPEPLLLVSWNH